MAAVVAFHGYAQQNLLGGGQKRVFEVVIFHPHQSLRRVASSVGRGRIVQVNPLVFFKIRVNVQAHQAIFKFIVNGNFSNHLDTFGFGMIEFQGPVPLRKQHAVVVEHGQFGGFVEFFAQDGFGKTVFFGL